MYRQYVEWDAPVVQGYETGQSGFKAEPSPEQGGLRALLPAAALLVAGVLGLGLATALADGIDGQYVVIAAPGGGPNAAIGLLASIDGAMVAPGGFSNIIIAASDRPDFADQLRRAGAWAVFPAPRFLGCATLEDMGISG